MEDDKAFAVAPVVTQTFSGAKYLVDNGVPTFGWNIQDQWALGPNLFAEKGSWLCFDCPNITPVFIAQQVGAKKARRLRVRRVAAVGGLRDESQEQLREVELPVRVHRHEPLVRVLGERRVGDRAGGEGSRGRLHRRLHGSQR